MDKKQSVFKNNFRASVNDFFNRLHDTFRFIRYRFKYLDPKRFSFLTNISLPLRSLFRPKTTILFYPERPASSTTIYKLCAVHGYAMTDNPFSSYQVAFKNKDSTFFDLSTLKVLPDKYKVINRNSVDISKNKVSDVFQEIFGYSLKVDPVKHTGPAVEKSDKNAMHDGRIVHCPVPAESVRTDCVYQKVIDNTVENGFVLDYRIPVHGGRIPLVYLKYRPQQTRFSNLNDHVELEETSAIFSEREQLDILKFAKAMGIEYGEFDVLRDNKEGRIYIVDANMTPWGPPNGLPKELQRKVVLQLAETFRIFIEQYREE
ncbi:hypothetical protein JXQ31_00310 [candidate division KSB1 bacterium]|nr:hypothetical protein [candidate division KSB1 bacterium]